MKTLKTKSEITASILKSEDCDYNGHRIGFDNYDKVYIRGNHFNSSVDCFETIADLKVCL